MGLESADLSGNFFGRVGFATVAAALRHSRLKSLSFAGNNGAHWPDSGPGQSGAKDGPVRFNPVQILVEGLHCNSSLEDFDLSDCGIGPDTAFVLEDALQTHQSMKSLILMNNPLGDAGLRSVMRLLLAIGSDIRSCNVCGHRGSDALAHPILQVRCEAAQAHPHEGS
jgi:Ran GTPase-activating protein (RanGAP) involved in mRNA processing and transport